MQISIPEEYQHFVHEQMKAGDYLKPDDLIGDALEVFMEHQRMRQKLDEKHRKEINEKIQAARDSQARGEMISAEEHKANMDKLFATFKN